MSIDVPSDGDIYPDLQFFSDLEILHHNFLIFWNLYYLLRLEHFSYLQFFISFTIFPTYFSRLIIFTYTSNLSHLHFSFSNLEYFISLVSLSALKFFWHISSPSLQTFAHTWNLSCLHFFSDLAFFQHLLFRWLGIFTQTWN